MRTATRLILGLAVLLFCTQAGAAIYYHIHVPLQNTYGSAMSGVTYYVLDAGTTDTSAVYSDRAGTRYYQGSERLTTDAGGMFDCYVLAGCYRIAFEDDTRWGDIADTLENYCYGIADSIGAGPVTATTLTVTGETQLGDAAGDTVDFYGRSLWRGDWYSNLTNSVLWLYHTSGTRDRGTDLARTVGFGPRSIQIEETGAITVAYPVPNQAGDYNRYVDDDLIGTYPYTGTESYINQTTYINASRESLHHWEWDGVTGAFNGDVGVAPIGMWFRTNLPDSNGTGGQRVAFNFEWEGLGTHTQIANSASSIMRLTEGGDVHVNHYDFRRDNFYLTPAAGGDVKGIIITGAGDKYTRLGQYTGDTATNLRCASGVFEIRTSTGGDSVRVDMFKADTDTVMFGINTVTYKGNLPTASGHTSQIWFNTALDSCFISTGAAWLQISLP